MNGRVRSKSRVLAATRSALSYAFLYSLLVAVSAVMTRGESLRRYGRSLEVIVAFHLAAAVFVGIGVGMFSRFATTRTRGGVLGALIGFPVAMTLAVLFRPEYSLKVQLIGAVASAVLIGGWLGYLLVERPR